MCDTNKEAQIEYKYLGDRSPIYLYKYTTFRNHIILKSYYRAV